MRWNSGVLVTTDSQQDIPRETHVQYIKDAVLAAERVEPVVAGVPLCGELGWVHWART